jgi:hypothetical protein
VFESRGSVTMRKKNLCQLFPALQMSVFLLFIFTTFVSAASFSLTKRAKDKQEATTERSLLYLVPGTSFKYPAAIENISNNLRIIEQTGKSLSTLKCVVYTYDDVPPPPIWTDESRKPNSPLEAALRHLREKCLFQVYYRASYADNIKAISPALVSLWGFSHVMLCLDDVILTPSFHVDALLQSMDRNDLALTSPAVRGT